MLLALASPQPIETFHKYRSDQARVPAGNPDGGQWTDDPIIITEARYEEAAYSQNTPDKQPERTHDFYVQRKQKFIDAHLTATEKAAKDLHVPIENILGLAGLESEWGASRFALQGNNFFGLYYPAPYGRKEKWIGAYENPKARIAVFDNYTASLNSFISVSGKLIRGKSDPTAFMASLQNSGKFGIDTNTGKKVPDYVKNTAATIRGLRSVIENSRKKAGKNETIFSTCAFCSADNQLSMQCNGRT